MSQTFRPKAEKKKIHSRNEFELCYLRHQYFRKVDYNPTSEEMQPYLNIAANLAKNTFFTYKNLFHMIGFEREDLTNIANIHLVSFLGLFSLEKMPQKYQDFIQLFNRLFGESPDEGELLDKNRANCTLFLKQRMEDVVRVCRQKARNIKGLPTEEFFFYVGTKKPPAILRDLIEKHEKLGYKKLDTAVFKSIRKKVRPDGPVFRFDGKYYVSVPVEQKSLSLSDFTGAGIDPYDSLHNMTPEEILFDVETADIWEKRQEEFHNKTPTRKAHVLKKFIKNNKNKPEYEEEVKTAKKLLKQLGV